MSHGHHGPPKEPIGWMDRPDTVKRLFTILYVIAGILFVLDFVLDRSSAHPHPIEHWPAFYLVYGFISFWFLVLLARPMRTLLIRAEDWYEGGGKYVEEDAGGHHGHGDADAHDDSDGGAA